MEAIEFVINYTRYLEEIEQVIKPEFYPAIQQLKSLDPHDFARPETWFVNETAARGYVWTMFLNEQRKLTGLTSA